MPTFAKGSVSGLPARHVRFVEKLEHAQFVAQLVEETGGDVAEERAKRRFAHTAVDAISLRGVPAIGRGVAGAIPGTKPGSNLFR